jgi:hypothetical protein
MGTTTHRNYIANWGGDRSCIDIRSNSVFTATAEIREKHGVFD